MNFDTHRNVESSNRFVLKQAKLKFPVRNHNTVIENTNSPTDRANTGISSMTATTGGHGHDAIHQQKKSKRLFGAEKRRLERERELVMQNNATPVSSAPKRGRDAIHPSKKVDAKNTPKGDSYAEALRKANSMVAVIDVGDNNTLEIINDDQYYEFLSAMQKLYIMEGNKYSGPPNFMENRNMRSAIN